MNLTDIRWDDHVHYCKSTKFCKLYGHSKKWTGKSDEYFIDKYCPGSRPHWIRKYYRGAIEYCTNPSCQYKKFEGDREFYRMTKIICKTGEEHEITEEDGHSNGERNTGHGQTPEAIDHGI